VSNKGQKEGAERDRTCNLEEGRVQENGYLTSRTRWKRSLPGAGAASSGNGNLPKQDVKEHVKNNVDSLVT
jgi:hypothetical protein